jgi:hypothetical protein
MTPSQTDVIQLVNEMADENALYIDGYEDAIIGVADVWRDNTRRTVVVYDYETMILSMIGDDVTAEDAAEYIEFNISGAYVGPYQPIIVQRLK